jgi:hypothetical protein
LWWHGSGVKEVRVIVSRMRGLSGETGPVGLMGHIGLMGMIGFMGFMGWGAVEPGGIPLGLVKADGVARVVRVPARVNMTNGVLEYALVTDYGKTHESLLVTEAGARELHAALLLLRAQPSGTNALSRTGAAIPEGSRLEVSVAWEGSTGRVVRPLAEMVALTEGMGGAVTGRLSDGPWEFNGSRFTQEGYAAHYDGSLVSLIADGHAIVNSARPEQGNDEIHAAGRGVPAVGTPVMVEIRVIGGGAEGGGGKDGTHGNHGKNGGR